MVPPPPAGSESQTRQRLIDAAMELFWFQGYANTGLAQIARKADALPGSLYHFFPTKEDLLRATLEERLVRIWPDLLDPIWGKVDDPIERVFALLEGYRQGLIFMEFGGGCPIGNLALELAETHPNTRPLLAANFDNWTDAVEQCFKDASDRLPEGTDTRQLAVFVLTTMEGAIMLARTYRDFTAYDAAVTTLRDYIERLIAHGTAGEVPGARKVHSASHKRAR
ncbi:MAG: TetR/AcrR family transcriptional regulator [Phycisphaeraceae bacterium]|nr:TetR/AcrR family transcriptional regulator [Phycisphaerales bacterium]MCB9844040.1 TetR/AcrR family transcriptional regulator [Phycisphaeraceae bacterium]